MKKLSLIVSFVVLVSGFAMVFGACNDKPDATAETYVSMDINPSLELVLDGDEKVIAVRALNKDAEILLYGAEGIVRNFFDGEIADNGLYLLHPDYICNCSRRKIEGVLIPLGRDELLAICDERGSVSVHCHYCNTDYVFGRADILKLFDK